MFKKLNTQTKGKDDDAAEFEALFKKHYKPLCFMSYSIVKDMDIAEEIVQEFFYNYWKNMKTINIKSSTKSYFFKSIQNRSLKHLRSAAVKQKHEDYVTRQGRTDNSNGSHEIEAKELREIIEQTLDELPQRHACIFRMSRYEGLKYREIAENLSISVKTVEAAMGKVLAVFRNKLSDYLEFTPQDIKYTKLTKK